MHRLYMACFIDKAQQIVCITLYMRTNRQELGIRNLSSRICTTR